MKRKLNYILLFLLAIVILPLGVRAEEKFSIVAEAELGTTRGKLYLTLKGLPSTIEKYTNYYVYLCNDSDPAPTVAATSTSTPIKTAEYGVVGGWHMIETSDKDPSTADPSGKIDMSGCSNWYGLKGYTSAYVLTSKKDSNGSYTNTVSSKITIEKPKLFDYEKGYTFALGDKTSIHGNQSYVWPQYPYEDSMYEKISVKVGMMNDNTILKKYINSPSDAYSSLLTYAKNDKNGTTMNLTKGSKTFVSKIDKVVEGQNYYILITVNDNDYRDLTDVYLRTGDSINTLDKFSNQDSSTKSSSTAVKQMSSKVENPKTGDYNILIMVLALITTLGVFVFTYKKFKKVK